MFYILYRKRGAWKFSHALFYNDKNSIAYFGIDNVSGYNGHGLAPSRKPTGEIYTEYKLGNPYEKFNNSGDEETYLNLGIDILF